MATPKRWKAQKQAMFQSVFHGNVVAQQHSAPNSGFLSFTGSQLTVPFSTQPDETPGGSGLHPRSSPGDALTSISEQQLRWDRAWSHVTAAIQLPSSVATEDSFGSLPPSSQGVTLDDGDGDWHEAIQMVLHPQVHAPGARNTSDVLLWHTLQVRRHFVHHVLPLLSACDTTGDPHQVLLGTVRTLEAAHRQYLWGFTLIARGLDTGAADVALTKFQRDLHAIIGKSMSDALMGSLALVVGGLVDMVLGLDGNLYRASRRKDARVAAAKTELLGLLSSLASVGLAGERFQVMLADLMGLVLDKFVHASYARTWPSAVKGRKAPSPQTLPATAKTASPSTCIAELRGWVEKDYAQLMADMFRQVGSSQVVWSDVPRWKDLAVGRLAAIRIRELFDIVLHWPDSRSDLQDLRASVTTPQRRLELTDTFSAALHKRLLHPGRSTLEILQVYISMIRTFHTLDPSKVLLDRVVRSLQLYLCQRDDAIRIVVTGLLADPRSATDDDAKDKLVELAAVLNDPAQQRRQNPDDEELDWNDMDWVPDPIDAGVNYKRPKSEDVIGTLISALGAKDVFIKEFQSIIAERLLSPRTKFAQDMRVLGLLRKRFGEVALQNCDVMLRDIRESKALDDAIGKWLPSPAHGGSSPEYHTKILSRLYWPTQEREFFVVPPPVAAVQRAYSQGFERTKAARKLAWIDNLGTASVRLELQDRPFECECKTYEAAVIYAFHDDDAGSEPARRTVGEIEESLMLDRDLIVSSLRFWTKHGILRQSAPDTYVVIENIEDDATRQGQDAVAADDATAAGAVEDSSSSSAAAAAVKKAQGGGRSAQENEQRQVYWQFIVGMLTNSMPAMPLANMAMMMGMLVPGGFKWSHEDLRDFLGEKVAAWELEFAGGKYRLPKK